MSDVTVTDGALVPLGVNQSNLILAEAQLLGACGDGDDFFVTFADLAGKALVPIAIQLVDEATTAEDLGARTHTLFPSEPAAGTGIQPVSYAEATGILSLKNQTGGALTDAAIVALFAPLGEYPVSP